MMTSIDDLPEEVLIQLFHSVLELDFFCNPLRRAALALVCKQWHRIVYGSPSLWTRISTRYSPTQTILALEKSQPIPIAIAFSFSGDAVDGAFIIACDHMHRWKDAWINLGILQQQALYNLLSTPAPLLEKIYITGPPYPLSELRINLFNGQAPRLRHLHLNALGIPWDAAFLSSLVTLDLTQLRAHRPTISELMSILHASPQLSILRLAYMAFQPPSETSSLSVSLPCLQEIWFLYIDVTTIDYLSSRIQSPPCRTLKVTCRLISEEDLSRLSHLPGFPLSEDDTRTLTVGPYYVGYTYDDSRGLDLGGRGVLPHIILRRLASILPSHIRAQSTELQTRAPPHYSEADTVDWVSVAEAADAFHVTRLKLFGAGSGLAGLITRLGKPGGSGSWLLPGLTEIDLDLGAVPFSSVADLIEARHGAEGPAPITKVTVTCAEMAREEDRARVERIIGANNLSWNTL